MNQLDLNIIVEETMVSIQRLLQVKGGEYAGSEDRLANFKRGGGRVGIHPLQTLWVYASKHIDSIETYIRDIAGGVHRVRSEPIEGRLDDLINYCLLAKALIAESGAEQKVVDHRDGGLDGGRLRGELVPDSVGSARPVAERASDTWAGGGDDGAVYAGFTPAGIRAATPVQLDTPAPPRVAAFFFQCRTCRHRSTVSPQICNCCEGADRYEHE